MEAHQAGIKGADWLIDHLSSSKAVEMWARHQNIPVPASFSSQAARIRFLEEVFRHSVDDTTLQMGGGRFHHHRDLAHHASLTGLFFSLFSQFTGFAAGLDSQGHFQLVPLSSSAFRGKNQFEQIFYGTVLWLGHLISDMGGSSTSASRGKAGTGIPGPFLSFWTTLTALPGFSQIFSSKEGESGMEVCCQFFLGKETGVALDLRTEMGLLWQNFENKRLLGPMISEILIRIWYFTSRSILLCETEHIQTWEEFQQRAWKRCLPLHKEEVQQLSAWTAASFLASSLSFSAIKAVLKNRRTQQSYLICFVEEVNLFSGIYALAAISPRAKKMVEQFHTQIETACAALPDRDLLLALQGARFIGQNNPVQLALVLLEEIHQSDQEYRQARTRRLETEQLCQKQIASLQREMTLYERAIQSYFQQEVYEVLLPLHIMENASSTEDFFQSNISLQKHCHSDLQPYASSEEFESFMKEEEVFVF